MTKVRLFCFECDLWLANILTLVNSFLIWYRFFLSRWYFLLCVQEMSCFSVCCTCFILPQDQFVSTTIIICLFPVHLCKQHCLKHPTLVFPRLVVLSLENNHTHPSEGQMTILRGKGVLQGKSPKSYWNFQQCFFGGGGGGGGQWGGGLFRVIPKTSSCRGLDIF